MKERDLSSALIGLNVFVGGPIQHAILPDGFYQELRTAISCAITEVVRCGGNVMSAHLIEEFGLNTSSFTPAQVTSRDFQWMKKCDVFVPVLPVLPSGELLRTDGTHVELGWASALGRPIVPVTNQPLAESASHLLKGLHTVARVEPLDIDELRMDAMLLIERIVAVMERSRGPLPASVPARVS